MPERLHDLDDVPDTGGLSPGSATQPSPSCRLGGLHHAVVGRLGIAAPGSGVKASRQGCRECRRQARGRQQGAELRAGVGACGGLNCRTHINKTAATSRCRCLPGESALFPAPFARGTLCTAFLWRLSEPESRDLEDSVILIRFTFLCCCQKQSSHRRCQDDMGYYTLGVRHFARGMRTPLRNGPPKGYLASFKMPERDCPVVRPAPWLIIGGNRCVVNRLHRIIDVHGQEHVQCKDDNC